MNLLPNEADDVRVGILLEDEPYGMMLRTFHIERIT